MIKRPRLSKWLYIIYGRGCIAPLLAYASFVTIPEVFTADSAEQMIRTSLGCLLGFFCAYFVWVRLGRVYLTIPYRKEIVDRALGLRIKLSPHQARGYNIEKTKFQIEQWNKDRDEAYERIDQEIEKLIARHPGVSDDAREGLRQNDIRLGMPKAFVDFILGDSLEEKVQVSEKNRRLTCNYGRGKKNRLGNMTYDWEIKFLNGVVTSFKQL